MSRLYNRSSYLKLLNAKYSGSRNDIEGLDTMVKKIRVVGEWLNSRASTINYLYQIQKLLPSQLVLKIITFDADDKVTLRGQAKEMSDIFGFVNILENSSYFKDIQVKYTTKKKVADKELTEFEIVCPVIKKK